MGNTRTGTGVGPSFEDLPVLKEPKPVLIYTGSWTPPSMGRAWVCGDNAAMESLFALLRKNVLDCQHWDTRDQLRLANDSTQLMPL